MTLTGRNLSLRVAFTGLVLISVAVVVVFVGAANGKYVPTPVRLSIDELLAVSGALLAAALGVSMAAVYLRLFRRTPSLAVFFVIWFYLAMVVDVLKLVQVVLPSTPWPQFGPAISRIGVFGHVTGVMALFAAGLYAGGGRRWKPVHLEAPLPTHLGGAAPRLGAHEGRTGGADRSIAG